MKLQLRAALGWLLALSGPAVSHADPAEVSVREIERAAARAWFEEHISPSLDSPLVESVRPAPVLYDPNDARVPNPSPDRRIQTRRIGGERGSVVVQSGDLPPTAAESVAVQDWSSNQNSTDSNRREMFRFYLDSGH